MQMSLESKRSVRSGQGGNGLVLTSGKKQKKHPFKQRLKGVVISWQDQEINGRKRGRTNSFAGFGLHQPVDCKRAFGGDV